MTRQRLGFTMSGRICILWTALYVGMTTTAASTNARIVIQESASRRTSPSFEMVSVKENTFGNEHRSPVTIRTLPSGDFVASNVTIRLLILRAYGLASHQLVGGPSWIARDRFDVRAGIPDGIESGRIPEMLRHLLSERFGLAVRSETRDLGVYSLVPVHGGGELGPGIQRVTARCERAIEQRRRAADRGELEPSFEAAFVPPDPRHGNCPNAVRLAPGRVAIMGSPLSMLTYVLKDEVGRPVIDRTGLRGLYDLEFTWAPGSLSPGTHPSIFTALREQLGLTLQPATEPVELLVVEDIHRPMLN